jgi:hypothetical protein
MATDHFDSNSLRLTAGEIVKLTPLQKKSPGATKRRQSSSVHFVRLPYKQTLVAAGHLGDACLAVLVEIDHLRFKTHKNPVPLPNMALRTVGITRWAKARALHELERVGLIKVAWRGKKSPLAVC